MPRNYYERVKEPFEKEQSFELKNGKTINVGDELVIPSFYGCPVDRVNVEVISLRWKPSPGHKSNHNTEMNCVMSAYFKITDNDVPDNFKGRQFSKRAWDIESVEVGINNE